MSDTRRHGELTRVDSFPLPRANWYWCADCGAEQAGAAWEDDDGCRCLRCAECLSLFFDYPTED